MARTKAAARPAQSPTPAASPAAPLRQIRALDALAHLETPVAALRGMGHLAEVAMLHSEQELTHLHRNDLAALVAVLGESFETRLAHARQLIEGAQA